MHYDEALEKVSRITDAIGCEVDEGIKPLLAALLMFGVRTKSSCEGHDDHGHSYPWIGIEEESFSLVGSLLMLAATTEEKDWIFSTRGGLRIAPWNTSRPLHELQAEARELADRLKEAGEMLVLRAKYVGLHFL